MLSWLLPAQTDTITGDLNGDGLPEMAVLHRYQEGEKTNDYGEDTLAELVVYRLEEGTWRTWPVAEGPMMYAWPEHGFSRFSAAIERGALVLRHYSGGYTNVGFTHRFRWQNDRFELIGATSSVYERCDGGRELDYNLSTGKYAYREYTTDCNSDLDDPRVTVRSVAGRAIRKTPLLLKSFGAWDNKVVMPDGGSMGF